MDQYSSRWMEFFHISFPLLTTHACSRQLYEPCWLCVLHSCLPSLSQLSQSCTWRTKAIWRSRCLRLRPKAIRPGTAWGPRRPSLGTLGSCDSCRTSRRAETRRSSSSRQFCPPDSVLSTRKASSRFDKRTGRRASALRPNLSKRKLSFGRWGVKDEPLARWNVTVSQHYVYNRCKEKKMEALFIWNNTENP